MSRETFMKGKSFDMRRGEYYERENSRSKGAL